MKNERREMVTVEQVVESKTFCDFCGAEADMKGPGPHRWPYESNSVDDVAISHRKGDSFPGSETGKEFDLDCCPACWREKVYPALQRLLLRPVAYKEYGHGYYGAS